MGRGWNQAKANKLALASLFLFLSCSNETAVQVPIGSIIPISGYINLSENEINQAQLQMNLIRVDGHRQPIDGFAIDPATGAFSANLNDADLVASVGDSQPERWAAMGALPPPPESYSGKFAAASRGFARIEVYSKNDQTISSDQPSATARMAYTQAIFPIVRAASFRTQKTLLIHQDKASGFKLGEYGRVRVKVVNTDGQAIKDAVVSVLPFKDRAPAYTWTSPDLGSAFFRTDDTGLATVFPISIEGAEPIYQLAATAPGYCPSVTSSRKILFPNPNTEVMILTRCETLSTQPQFALSFDEDFSQLTLDGKPADRTYVHVNTPNISVQLKSESLELRGLRVEVFLDQEPRGTAIADYKIERFSDRVVLEIPKITNGANELTHVGGLYLFRIRSLYNERDLAAGAEPLVQEHYVNFSPNQPTLNARNIKITSEVGRPDVISGMTGSYFYLTDLGSTSCVGEAKVAFVIAGGNAFDPNSTAFYSCKSLPVAIGPLPAGFFPIGQRGGSYQMQVIFKNEFGSVSKTGANNTDKRQVYIDFGAASDPESQPVLFGSAFGFVAKGTSQPTTDQPTVFALGTVLTPGSIANFALRFASTNTCKHLGPTAQDGQSADPTGNSIDSFYITGQARTDDDTGIFRKCGSDYLLTSQSVSFPTASGDKASFVMKFRDYAGNTSTLYRFEIPPCNGNADAQVHCWQP